MVAFLVTCVVIAILIAGGIAISVHLHNTSIKGQRFYAAPRRYATDLTDVDMVYSSRKILVTLTVVLIALSVMAIGAFINVIVR